MALSLSADHLIQSFGLLGIALIVFAESGLLIGFFLPGDSLLFTAGAAAAGVLAKLHVTFNLWALLATVVVAAIAGDQVGYVIGRRAGPALFRRPESRLFSRDHLDRSHEFFERHGPKALVLARFVPIVRTFVPVVAGAGAMEYRTFVRFNVIGGVMWGVGITLLGYWFGRISFIKNNIELALVAIVIISILPIVIELVRSRRRAGV